jgi:hypothetical protein
MRQDSSGDYPKIRTGQQNGSVDRKGKSRKPSSKFILQRCDPSALAIDD